MEDIDNLKTNPGVLRLYGSRVKLRRENGKLIGLCPFHSEKSGSFTIFEKDCMFKCFGCGASGNVMQFVQKMDNCDFKTAVAKVREFLGENNWESQAPVVDATFRPAVESSKTYKTYTMPQYATFEKALEASPAARTWLLEERGITCETAQKLHLGFCQNVGNRAGDKNSDIADKGWVAFPCVEGDQVVAIKFRSIVRKAFCKQGGMATALFNTETIDLFEPVYLVEGECLAGDTEVLSPTGWVRLDQYSGQSVAQWFMGGRADFVKPQAYVSKGYTGDMFCFKSKTNLVNQVVTPEHRVLYCPEKRHREIDPTVRCAKDVPSKRIRFFRTCNLESPLGVPMTDAQIRLQVMIQADASVESRAEDKDLEGRHWQALNLDGWRIEVSKARKRKRIRKLLSEAGITFNEYETGRGSLIVRFYAPPGMFRKIFPAYLYQMSSRQREVFLDELQYWDSHTAKSGTRMYVSVIKENADLVQTMFACTGLSAKFGVESRGGVRQNKYWVSVSLRDKRGRHDLTSGTTIEKTKIPYSGRVYCLTVPSSFLIIRRENVISVTGNCDALALEQAGFHAVSLQSASTHPTPEQKDQLMRAGMVILAGDNDGGVGEGIMQKLWRELQERTYMLKWPAGVKDANQFFLETCKRDVSIFQTKIEELTLAARSQPMADVYSIQEVMQSSQQGNLTEVSNRFRFPQPDVDKMAILLPGSVLGLYATNTGMGKTAFTVQATLYNAVKYGDVVLNWQAELSPDEIATMITAQVLRKDRNTLTTEDKKQAAATLDGVKYYVGHNPSLNNHDEVLDLIEAAVKRLGATIVVLDTFHNVTASETNGTAIETMAANRIKNLAMKYKLKWVNVFQPRKSGQQSKGKKTHISDIRGAGAAADCADTVLAIHRDLAKHDDDMPADDIYEAKTLIQAQKTRAKGTGKAETYLMFYGYWASFQQIDPHHEEPENINYSE